jgi:hypothetical protein
MGKPYGTISMKFFPRKNFKTKMHRRFCHGRDAAVLAVITGMTAHRKCQGSEYYDY